MSDTPPDVRIEKQRQSRFSRVSIIWLIPLLAIVIALGVAWQTYSARGPVKTHSGARVAWARHCRTSSALAASARRQAAMASLTACAMRARQAGSAIFARSRSELRNPSSSRAEGMSGDFT